MIARLAHSIVSLSLVALTLGSPHVQQMYGLYWK